MTATEVPVAAAPAAATAGGAPAGRLEPLTVLVADDHPLFRRGIARAVSRHPNLTLVAEAADGREALALITAMQPDVAVLDHRMPGLSGVEVCGRLQLHPGPSPTAVLLLSAFESFEVVSAAVGAGAAGYVGKSASHSEICAAIERVGAAGHAFVCAGASEPPRPLPRNLRPRRRPA